MITVPAELVKRLRVNQQMVDVTKVGDEWREVEPGPETTIELVVDRSLAPELAEAFGCKWTKPPAHIERAAIVGRAMRDGMSAAADLTAAARRLGVVRIPPETIEALRTAPRWVLFRPVRASLHEAMSAVIMVPATRDALLAHLLSAYGFAATAADMAIEDQGPDERIGWDASYIVTISGKAVGYVNGALSD